MMAKALPIFFEEGYLWTPHSVALRSHEELYVSTLLAYAFPLNTILLLHNILPMMGSKENLQMSARAVWQVAVLLLQSQYYL